MPTYPRHFSLDPLHGAGANAEAGGYAGNLASNRRTCV
jgi:hypothetical protein